MRGKPQLIKLIDKSGNLKSPYWYIHYYEGRGRRVSTGYLIGAQDHEATLALATFVLERERPTAREPDKLMTAQALKDYWNEHAQYTASSKHFAYHETRLNRDLEAPFVGQITQGTTNAYIRKCQARGESNGTIRRDLETLKAALNHEVREQRLIYAPKFKMPPQPPARDRVLSEDEIKRLKEACKTPHVLQFIEIMLHTGQRPGAVENLTWFQVDFENRIIHFDRNGKQQSNKRARPVAMNQALYVLLKKLHKEKTTSHVLEYDDIITGKRRHAGNVKKAFERACKHAKLENVSPYSLRHTVLDRLNDVADEKTASDVGGHTNTRTTRRNYIKSKMPKQREAMDNLWK